MATLDCVQNPAVFKEPVNISVMLPKHHRGGYFSQRRNMALIFSEEVLCVVDGNNGQCLQMWKCKYGKIYNVHEVMCGSNHFLAVTLCGNTETHIIAILNASALEVLKLIELKSKVTNVDVIDRPLCDLSIVNKLLLHFNGILAIGCKGGKIYLLNLNLDEYQSYQQYESVHQPLSIKVIDNFINKEEIEELGRTWQVAVLLMQECFEGHHFKYQHVTFPSNEVFVSTMHYAKQISSLLIGFNFGSFLVYSLANSSPIYYSPCSPQQLLSPITHFVYLEPENDPKCFVYIWVARGNRSRTSIKRSEYETKLTLYQMIFSEKKILQGETLYYGFEGCAPRMDYALTSLPSIPNPQASVSSSLFNCCSINRFRKACDGYCNEEDLSIAAFVWSANVNQEEKFFVGIFDINQWYQAQMPNVVRWRKSGKHTGVLGCSYFSFFCLDHLMKDKSGDGLLDICINDVSMFISHPPVPETHLWPSSVKFCAVVLRKCDILSCIFLGLPRHALHELDVCRSILYAQPNNIFNVCAKADLVHLGWEDDSQITDVNVQRKCLLNVIIDEGCPFRVLNAFIDSWSFAGASDPILFEWLNEKLSELVKEKGQLCGSYSTANNPPVYLLERFIALCNSMDRTMVQVTRQQSGISTDLVETSNFIYLQRKITEVLVFSISNGLMDIILKKSLYDHYYDLKRNNDSELLLAIDYLCKELEPTSVAYPPKSVSEFLNIFMSSNLKAIQCYILYLLYDIELLQDDLYGLSSLYNVVMCLSSQLVNDTKTMWMMDNHLFKDMPYSQLSTFEWQHIYILKKFLAENYKKLSLQYISEHGSKMQSIEEVKLKMAVYVINDRIHHGYAVMEHFKDSQYHEELFEEFIRICHKERKLCLLQELELCDMEEVYLLNFITKLESPNLCQLLMYYLCMNFRVSEAIYIHEDLLKSLSSSFHEDVIIDGYMNLLSRFVNKTKVEHSTSKSTMKVHQSLSAIVAGNMEFQAFNSQAGQILCDFLNIRCPSQCTPLRNPVKSPDVMFTDNISQLKPSRGDKNNTIDVHTPKRKERSITDESFLKFQSRIHEFKDRIAVNELSTTEFVSTPLSKATPSSILKGDYNRGYSQSRSIHFSMEISEAHELFPTETRSSCVSAPKTTAHSPNSAKDDDYVSPVQSPSQMNPSLVKAKMVGNGSSESFEGDPSKCLVTGEEFKESSVNSLFKSHVESKLYDHETVQYGSLSKAPLHSILPSSESNEHHYTFMSPTTTNIDHSLDAGSSTTSIYTFSPPITRSVARRKQQLNEESVTEYHFRSLKVKSTLDPVSFVSPPLSLISTSIGKHRKKTQKKPKSDKSIRRSKRLLSGGN